MGGEGILEAVEIVVEDGHFAVELVVEGLGGGLVGVHCLRNGRGYICERRGVSVDCCRCDRAQNSPARRPRLSIQACMSARSSSSCWSW